MARHKVTLGATHAWRDEYSASGRGTGHATLAWARKRSYLDTSREVLTWTDHESGCRVSDGTGLSDRQALALAKDLVDLGATMVVVQDRVFWRNYWRNPPRWQGGKVVRTLYVEPAD